MGLPSISPITTPGAQAWPVLGHVPAPIEALGLFVVMAGLIIAVTTGRAR